MTFYIDTQYLENYGIHTDNATGKFADDQARWKFKFGDTYAVTGLDRVQDAVAFVCALTMHNGLDIKEFPVAWKSEQEHQAYLDTLTEDYAEFLQACVWHVNPTSPTLKYRDEEEFNRLINQ
jgi:hypothetical protein